MNGILKLDWTNVKSALVYGVLSAFLAIALYINEVHSVFLIDWKALVNAGVFGGLTAVISLIKNLLTTNSGNFLGIINVIPDTK